jgi:hypothetical protein
LGKESEMRMVGRWIVLLAGLAVCSALAVGPVAADEVDAASVDVGESGDPSRPTKSTPRLSMWGSPVMTGMMACYRPGT